MRRQPVGGAGSGDERRIMGPQGGCGPSAVVRAVACGGSGLWPLMKVGMQDQEGPSNGSSASAYYKATPLCHKTVACAKFILSYKKTLPVVVW